MNEPAHDSAAAGKGVATAVIWLGIGIAIGFSHLENPINIYSLGLAIVLVIAASISTALIWNGAGLFTEKAKRGSSGDATTELLLHLLNEDDRKSLRSRLINEVQSDGELMSAADLLATDGEQHSR